MAFANVRSTGIIAISFDEGDSLINARITDGSLDVILGTRNGQAIRFPEEQVRAMGRTARGVKGMSLREGDEVVGMETVPPDGEGLMITVCERGFGKGTEVSEYPTQKRGGLGVITIKTTERNGPVVDLRLVEQDDHILLVTVLGKIIRLAVAGISVQGRNTQGVTLVKLNKSETVVSVATVKESEEDGSDEGSDGDEGAEPGGDGAPPPDGTPVDPTDGAA